MCKCTRVTVSNTFVVKDPSVARGIRRLSPAWVVADKSPPGVTYQSGYNYGPVCLTHHKLIWNKYIFYVVILSSTVQYIYVQS